MHIRSILLTYTCLLWLCLQSFAQPAGNSFRGDPRKASNPAIIQVLDLSYTKLSALDSSILLFKNLIHLDLKGNDIRELPSWISELHKLQSINLASNPNFKAGSLSYLADLQIRTLVLDGCNLVYLPEKIKEFSSLEELDLGNNLLQSADKALFELASLRALVLRNNHIDSIEIFAGENNIMEWLDISNNPLVHKDEQIKKLDRLRSLKHLGFQGCSKIPSAIGRITTLTSLDIRNSSLKDINQAITNLERLERLTLANCPNINYTNAFTVIGQLKTLRYLEFGYPNPKATIIPDQIRHLKNLRTLIIDNGMQVDLNSLMMDLSRLPELTELRIRGARYDALSNEVFRLTHLEILDFSDNHCSELPFELNNMKHLKQLDIRGNNIKADRVENLEEALKGYCYILSDYNFKAPLQTMGTKPLVSNGKPLSQKVTVNAESGGTISFGPNVRIVVPPGCLLLPNGTPAKGEVQLNYCDLSSPISFSLAGISMNYDSNGYEYLLSSAGMFELTCEQAGTPLKIAPGKSITVTMPGTDPGKKYNVYQYDPTLRTWIEKPGQSIEAKQIEPTGTAVKVSRPVFSYRMSKERLMLTHTKVKNDQTFTFGIVNYESPAPTATIEKSTSEGHMLYLFELRNFTGVTWIYDGKNAAEDYKKVFHTGAITYGSKMDDGRDGKRSIALTYINDIRLRPNPDGSDNFLMEFYINNEVVAALPVLPLKYANDPYSIQKRINRQYRRYSSDLTRRVKYYAKAQADYDSEYRIFEEKMESYRAYMRENRNNSSRKEGLVERTLDVAGFGVWNHDVTFRMRNMKKMRIDKCVSDQGGATLKPQKAVVVDLTFYSCVDSDPFYLTADMADKNVVLFTLGDDKLGILYDEALKVLASGGSGIAKLKVIDCKGLSHEEILARIGI